MSESWYALSADDVAAKFAVDPAKGLSAAEAARLLAHNGPNALPTEKPKPGWRRLLDQYRNYMQIILVSAVIASIDSRCSLPEMPSGSSINSTGSPKELSLTP